MIKLLVISCRYAFLFFLLLVPSYVYTTNVQDAISELDKEKSPAGNNHDGSYGFSEAVAIREGAGNPRPGNLLESNFTLANIALAQLTAAPQTVCFVGGESATGHDAEGVSPNTATQTNLTTYKNTIVAAGGNANLRWLYVESPTYEIDADYAYVIVAAGAAELFETGLYIDGEDAYVEVHAGAADLLQQWLNADPAYAMPYDGSNTVLTEQASGPAPLIYANTTDSKALKSSGVSWSATRTATTGADASTILTQIGDYGGHEGTEENIWHGGQIQSANGANKPYLEATR